jgi:hypothetical protein
MSLRSQPTTLRAIMAGIIESKETVYRGVTMRSRLEADFARHLDNQGVEWRYEPAIYGPKGSGYLPDFQIDREDGPHFIEVKPTLRDVPEAARRMKVIWRTHPNATLVVACAEGSRFFAMTPDDTITWVDRWHHG